MISVFESYPQFWKGLDRPELSAILSTVTCVQYPREATQMMAVKNQQQTVVVMSNATLKQMADVIHLGFEHCVQADRPDFPQELLAATLMAARFEAFVRNPIPFFFTGFQGPAKAKNVDMNQVIHFKGSTEKTEILMKLTDFLSKQPNLKAVSDLCVQAADEMVSNAIYSAPVDNAGQRLYQDFDRTTPVQYPPLKQATLFASFSNYRVVVGVEDPFGSLGKAQFTDHLTSILEPGPLAVKRASPSAGLGIRFMIDNAANFYVYSDKKNAPCSLAGFS